MRTGNLRSTFIISLLLLDVYFYLKTAFIRDVLLLRWVNFYYVRSTFHRTGYANGTNSNYTANGKSLRVPIIVF